MPNVKGLLPAKVAGILVALTLGTIAMAGAAEAAPIT